MYNLRLIASARLDMAKALQSYRDYFEKLGDVRKGEKWADDFLTQFRAHLNELKNNPFKYHICTLYPFDKDNEKYRYFTIKWHAVFYFVENDTVYIARILSAKTDFSAFFYF